MAHDAEERLTFQLAGLSLEEIDEFTALLHQHSPRADDQVHRDVSTALHTVYVFLGQHRDEIKTGASLAIALIPWLRDWRKRVAAETAAKKAARRPEIEIVRADQTRLRLHDATDEEVRRFLNTGGTTR